jgi:prepilin-type N-terminal cleavage/methylation domain-containing protein
MSRRGFTVIELLAAMGVAAIGLVILASAVRSQGTTAVYQMGAADMQQNVRGALNLFRREVRMAGYGMSAVPSATLPILRVPAVGAGELYRVELFGNYGFVKSRVNADTAANATVILMAPASASACLGGTPAKVFTPGQRIAIESTILGVAEVRTIGAYSAVNCSVTVTAAFANPYPAGSVINEIQEVRYILNDSNVLQRNGIVVADQIEALQLAYILQDGTEVANPAAVLPDLRSASIRIHSEMAERNGMQPEAELESEVRIRNLAIIRTPAID